MGENLTKATENLKAKHNFANLIEEHNYVNAVNEAIETLEGSGGGGGVTEQFVTDAVQVETEARTLADTALQTEANNTFITKTDGADAIANLAPKSGLYQTSITTNIVDLETQCQNFHTRILALEATAIKQTTLSPEQMKGLQDNILAELLKKIAK